MSSPARASIEESTREMASKAELGVLYRRLLTTLTEISTIASLENSLAADARKKVADVLITHKPLFPIPIWTVIISHSWDLGRYKSDPHRWCTRKDLEDGEEIQGIYFTLEDAEGRSQVLQREAIQAGAVMDKRWGSSEWAMTIDGKRKHKEENGKTYIKRLQLKCYIQNYEVDGPGCTEQESDGVENYYDSEFETEDE